MVASKSRFMRTSSGKIITLQDAQKAGLISQDALKDGKIKVDAIPEGNSSEAKAVAAQLKQDLMATMTAADKAKLMAAASDRLGYKVNPNTVKASGSTKGESKQKQQNNNSVAQKKDVRRDKGVNQYLNTLKKEAAADKLKSEYSVKEIEKYIDRGAKVPKSVMQNGSYLATEYGVPSAIKTSFYLAIKRGKTFDEARQQADEARKNAIKTFNDYQDRLVKGKKIGNTSAAQSKIGQNTGENTLNRIYKQAIKSQTGELIDIKEQTKPTGILRAKLNKMLADA